MHIDGYDLFYEEHGRGTPLVLLHGFTDSGRDLEDLAQPLSRHFHVIRVDMPGQGRSQPQPRPYHSRFYEEDAMLIWTLLDRLGVPAAHLGGFSDGAEVVLLMAILRPAAALSVAAWGVAGQLEAGALPEVNEIGAMIDTPEGRFAGWREGLIENYGEPIARGITGGWAEAVRALIAEGGDISLSRADGIRCPVLIINGADDQVNPPAAVARLAARIPHAETIIVPDTGHGVHTEHPAWFLQTLEAWLARQEP
jgi:valacyclovir hydrolase